MRSGQKSEVLAVRVLICGPCLKSSLLPANASQCSLVPLQRVIIAPLVTKSMVIPGIPSRFPRSNLSESDVGDMFVPSSIFKS